MGRPCNRTAPWALGLLLGGVTLNCGGPAKPADWRLTRSGQSLSPVPPQGEDAQRNVPEGTGLHPTLETNMTLAEGDTGKPPLPAATAPKPTKGSESLPDPPATQSRQQWRFQFRYQAGQISVEAVEALHYEQAQTAARRMGRFALELWIGRELLERVRFDFPMLGAPEPETASGVELEAKLDSTRSVLIPHSPRATRAQLVDRKSGRVFALDWPPRPEGPPAVLEAEGPPVPPATLPAD